jgi:hypothetical protein
MQALRTNILPVMVALGLGAMVVLSAYGATGTERQAPTALWLSHFVGDDVVVTFISPPPGMGRAVKARLMDAEAPGIVLQLGREEIFFSFANIISVEPSGRKAPIQVGRPGR